MQVNKKSSATAPPTRIPKILHVIGSLDVGGAESQLVQMINSSSAPNQHHVAVFYALGKLANEIQNPPIFVGPFSRKPSKVLTNVRSLFKLRRLIIEHSIELIHAHLGFSELIAAISAPRRIPLVVSRRGVNLGFGSRRYLKVIQAFSHRRAALMLCNSDFLMRVTKRDDPWVPPIQVIHNGVDLSRFVPAGDPFREDPIVTVVANLRREKRIDRFLEAFNLLIRRVPAAKAMIVGEGPEMSNLEKMRTNLGLESSVAFLPGIRDARPHILASRLVALTSDSEGFPNALLEALACGRPVIASRVGGIPELVRDGEHGFLVSSDPTEIANAMHRLVTDKALWLRMSEQARERASEFSLAKMVSEIEGIYINLARSYRVRNSRLRH